MPYLASALGIAWASEAELPPRPVLTETTRAIISARVLSLVLSM